MTSIPDHYAALGIDPTADQEVITAAYRALAKKFHPDTGATTGTANPDRFDQVQRAWEVLRTPESRHRYDLELLAATERELEEHLATKRRVVPFSEPGKAVPLPPDLGDIRPEPATRPTAAASPPRRPRKKPSLLPFLVPLALLLAIAAGGAWLFLPKGPAAPPLPASAKTDAPKAVAAKTEVAAVKPAPDAAPAAATETPPLFGSSATDPIDAPVVQAAATPVPAPDAAANGADAAPASAKPIFGSSLETAPVAGLDPAEQQAPPPLPKPRPAAPPAGQANQQPVTQPPPAQDIRRLPGGAGPYRLVIFERQPGQVPTAWSAGVVFDTQGSCTKFGVKAVLRRMANLDPGMADTKIWYECQVASAQ